MGKTSTHERGKNIRASNEPRITQRIKNFKDEEMDRIKLPVHLDEQPYQEQHKTASQGCYETNRVSFL